VDATTGDTTTLAGTPGMWGAMPGFGTGAVIGGPNGITSDGKGTLYVGQQAGPQIIKIDISTKQVSWIAGGVMAGSADGTGMAASFQDVRRMVLDPTGKFLYVSDRLNDAIRKVDVNSGAVTTVAGTPHMPYVTVGALPGTLNQPWGLAFDAAGDLLVAVPREDALFQIRFPQ
jgi:hypothetical protein